MLDVAANSGVSHQTVSRVLNNHVNVSQKTRAKVLESMTRLGYAPNLAARALSNGKTTTIGILQYESPLFGPVRRLLAVQRAARDIGYAVTLATTKGVDKSALTNGIQELIRSGVDGIILISPLTGGATLEPEVLGGIPCVTVVGDILKDAPSVNVDQLLGAKNAVEYLISLGHTNIAHISGPNNWYEATKRREGWQKALKDAGLSPGLLVYGDWSAESGYQAIREIVGKSQPTAVFVANDAMALGGLKALNELKINVPQEISIIGFDDIPDAEYLIPGLTTIRNDFDEVGKRSVELLMDCIRKKQHTSYQIVIKPELIIRKSTSPPLKSRKIK